MIAILLVVILLIGAPLRAQTTSPAVRGYASGGLQQFISQAALVNSQIPNRLRAYRARVETEMALALLDSGRLERTAQVEQISSDVRYRNPDRYDQRVIGYRN